MFDLIQMLFWAIVAFVILVAVHEFGHFWVARKLGVKVLRFSIGFGRVIWSRRGRDGVEYVLSAIPLGGYVKMVDEREDAVASEDLPYAFNRKSVGVRSAIVFAGPLFNFLFAILAYWAVFAWGEYDRVPRLGELGQETPVYQAGLRSNDTVLEVNGKETPTWNRMFMAVLDSAIDNEPASLRVRSEAGDVREVVLGDQVLHYFRDGSGDIGQTGLVPYLPDFPAVVREVIAGGASVGVFEPGDVILAVDGRAMKNYQAFIEQIEQHPGTPMEVEIERDGSRMLVELTPAEQEGRGLAGIKVGARVPEGYVDDLTVFTRYGLLESVPLALAKTWEMTGLTLKGIWKMVTGQLSFRNIGGPVTIVKVSGSSAQYGFAVFAGFLAMLSITLGVVNLLPIPVLDGGHLMFYLVEAVRGSALSDEAMMQIQKIGMLIILGIMMLAIYVDLGRFFGIP
ncbi:MAG: RIP metalloprotease RseP [Gammaproteobacteria bacterium]